MTNDESTLSTVGDWLDAFEPKTEPLRHTDKRLWNEQRLRRLHGLQVAQDAIAHVHAMPLRLLRVDNLVALDQTLSKFVTRWESEILALMTQSYADGSPCVPVALEESRARELLRKMRDEPEHLHTLRKWILRLADSCEEETEALLRRPEALPEGYVDWFLMLLPHVERDVWLTNMGNALPVHTLTRMVEHWSLYILMWAWEHSSKFSQPTGKVENDALQRAHLGFIAKRAFDRQGHDRPSFPVVLVGGPFLMDSAIAEEDGSWYVDPLRTYLGRIERVCGVQGWQEVREKAPGATELLDALHGRHGLTAAEAELRFDMCDRALGHLRAARMDASLIEWADRKPNRPLSRANWETIGVLASWYTRTQSLLGRGLGTGAEVSCVSIQRHRVSLVVGSRHGEDRLVYVAYAADREDFEGLPPRATWRMLNGISSVSNAPRYGPTMESAANQHARMRERRQAVWTAHVAAIHHLLSRHSPRERPEGADDPSARNGLGSCCEEADHLLRGFGGRISRYLLDMVSADVVDIYWLDYSNDPPRLRHVAGAERLLQHRAARQDLLTRFDDKIWQKADADGQCTLKPGVDIGTASQFQFYRAAATARAVPEPAERKAKESQEQQAQEGPSRGYRPEGELDIFPDPRPEDAVCVPLLFNDRVVGVLGVAGIGGRRHFDLHLYPPLRLVAQMLAQVMYANVQLWQMRQINWLASHKPLQEWRQHDVYNNYNPLLPVARCLANVFLCPGAQIWLRDAQNPNRYKLHGNTAPAMFKTGADSRGHIAPFLLVAPSEKTPAQRLGRSFLAFAIDQYGASNGSKLAPGRYVQALYVGGPGKTEHYALADAERGTLQLRGDFLSAARDDPNSGGDATSSLRDAIYETRKWRQSMAFALLGAEPHGHSLVGVVGLFANHTSPVSGEHPELNTEVRQPWPPGWHQAVAHIQTYLPYVLMQTETIANPLDEMRRYLLHEGRNELNSMAFASSSLANHLDRLLTVDKPGIARPWLREWVPRIKRSDDAQSAAIASGLEQIERLLEEAASLVNPLDSIEAAESLSMLGRLIENQRDVADLYLDLSSAGRIHNTEWLSLREGIWSHFDAYKSGLRERRVFWSVDSIDANFKILTQATLWRWMIGNLVHNVFKYAKTDSGADVKLSSISDGYVLTLRNESTFDVTLDDPQRLVTYGTRGSAGQALREARPALAHVDRGSGTGIGLWGVSRLAKVLGMSFEVRVVALTHEPGHANYFFELRIPRRLIRRH